MVITPPGKNVELLRPGLTSVEEFQSKQPLIGGEVMLGGLCTQLARTACDVTLFSSQ